MESFNATNTTANKQDEQFWIIVSCISIASTVIEILVLVVSCVYYRWRIDGLNKTMLAKPTGTGIMRHNVERQSKVRKSLAVSIMRYVMEPTSSKTQLEDLPYSYATQEELYLEMNTTRSSQDNLQTEISTVEQEPVNASSNYEEVSSVLFPEKKHEGMTEVASDIEEEAISEQTTDSCGSHTSVKDETMKHKDKCRKTASRDEKIKGSNAIKTNTQAISATFSCAAKTNTSDQRKHPSAYSIDRRAQECDCDSEETKVKKIREDNYTEYKILSSESNVAETKDKSVKESTDSDDGAYMNVELTNKCSNIDSRDYQMKDGTTDESVDGTGNTERNEKRESYLSGSSEDSNSSEISVKVKGQFEREYSQQSSERYVNVTLNIAQVVGDVHMGPCRVYKSEVSS